MLYTSTRGAAGLPSAAAIARGIADDGGLFVPETMPHLSGEQLQDLSKMSYRSRAMVILSLFLTDYSQEELRRCVDGAYCGSFDNDQPAPLHQLDEQTHILELWHGPTCAFKDLALQLLPYLLTNAMKKSSPDKKAVILVATSGDTGKAALAGFADVPGTEIIVFYPRDGVSDMQKLQMTTQRGNNVSVCAIAGNFDDAQTGVKTIFADQGMRQWLAAGQREFSSANSINFGRLVPQVIYYVSAYCDLLAAGKTTPETGFNVVVPTGNFGNILAAYYAKLMGVPVRKLICASNRNRVLTDFLTTGEYNRNRPFYTTTSPSMDILISSNLERLLYHVSGDAPLVKSLMEQLKTAGSYRITESLLTKISGDFAAGTCDDAQAEQIIGDYFRRYHYLCDPHTAVALKVYEDYRRQNNSQIPTVIASTASAYKFAPAVLPALTDTVLPADDFAKLQLLSELSGTEIPAPLAALRGLPVLHPEVTEKTGMADFIRRRLS